LKKTMENWRKPWNNWRKLWKHWRKPWKNWRKPWKNWRGTNPKKNSKTVKKIPKTILHPFWSARSPKGHADGITDLRGGAASWDVFSCCGFRLLEPPEACFKSGTCTSRWVR
jgi:hypothetical protein